MLQGDVTLHSELSKREKLSTTWLIGWLLIAAVVLTAFNTLLFKMHWNSAITDLMIIAVSVIGIYTLIKRNLVSYKYCIIEDDFIVHEVLGSKEKRILNLNVQQIEKFAKTCDLEFEQDKKGSFTSKKRLYNCAKKPNRHYIIYKDQGEKRWFTFQPSDQMVELIEEKLQARSY